MVCDARSHFAFNVPVIVSGKAMSSLHTTASTVEQSILAADKVTIASPKFIDAKVASGNAKDNYHGMAWCFWRKRDWMQGGILQPSLSPFIWTQS